jgi:hypothetical protein
MTAFTSFSSCRLASATRRRRSSHS